MQLLLLSLSPCVLCVYTCMHVWYGVLCMQQSLLISIETWHRHFCIFSPRSPICPTPTSLKQTHTYTSSPPSSLCPPLLPILRATTSLSRGFVLWACRRVSSHKWISPHIPLSIKEPVCAPTAARSTPLQLFVPSDTSTCYLYQCCDSGFPASHAHKSKTDHFFFLVFCLYMLMPWRL